MNIYAIMSANHQALAEDSTLLANAAAWFDSDIGIFIDPPADNPIGEDDAPYIQLHSWFKQASDNQREMVCGHRISVVIFDDQDAQQLQDNAFEIRGTSRLTTIIRRINAVLLANRPVNATFTYDWDTDTETLFPALVAVGEITYTKRLTSPMDLDEFY